MFDRIDCRTEQEAETAQANYRRAGWQVFSIFQNDSGAFSFMIKR